MIVFALELVFWVVWGLVLSLIILFHRGIADTSFYGGTNTLFVSAGELFSASKIPTERSFQYRLYRRVFVLPWFMLLAIWLA